MLASRRPFGPLRATSRKVCRIPRPLRLSALLRDVTGPRLPCIHYLAHLLAHTRWIMNLSMLRTFVERLRPNLTWKRKVQMQLQRNYSTVAVALEGSCGTQGTVVERLPTSSIAILTQPQIGNRSTPHDHH